MLLTCISLPFIGVICSDIISYSIFGFRISLLFFREQRASFFTSAITLSCSAALIFLYLSARDYHRQNAGRRVMHAAVISWLNSTTGSIDSSCVSNGSYHSCTCASAGPTDFGYRLSAPSCRHLFLWRFSTVFIFIDLTWVRRLYPFSGTSRIEVKDFQCSARILGLCP